MELLDRRRFVALTGGTLSVTGCLHDNPHQDDGEDSRLEPDADDPDTEPEGLGTPLEEGPGDEFSEVVTSVQIRDGVLDLWDSLEFVGGVMPEEFGETEAAAVAAAIRGGTEDEPPVLRTAFINEAQDPVEFDPRELPPYRGVAEVEESSLYLVPSENNPITDEPPSVSWTGDRWTVEPENYSLSELQPETVTLLEETGLIADYHVVTDDVGAEPGRYSFGGQGDESRNRLELQVWDDETPGPSRDSRFEGMDIPDLIQHPYDDLEHAPEELRFFDLSFYHDADRSSQVYLEPEHEKLELPGEVEFELVNRQPEALSGGTSNHLYKLVGGEFYEVATQRVTEPTEVRIQPGEHRSYSLGLAAENRAGFDADLDVGYVGGGIYAFYCGIDHERTRLSALVEAEAPELEVEADEEAEVEHHDNHVKVSVAAEETAEAVVQLTEDDGQPVIAEQLYDSGGGDEPGGGLVPNLEVLRNAIPQFEGEVEEVRVEMTARSIEQLFEHSAADEDHVVYEYEGQAYEVTR